MGLMLSSETLRGREVGRTTPLWLFFFKDIIDTSLSGIMTFFNLLKIIEATLFISVWCYGKKCTG